MKHPLPCLLLAALCAAFSLTFNSVSAQSKSECAQGGIAQITCEIDRGDYAAIDRLIVLKGTETLVDQAYTPRYEVVIDEPHTQAPEQYQYNNRKFHPFFGSTNLHSLQSATKSVNSLGIGLAIKDGLIKSVKDPAITYLAKYKYLMNGKEWETITVEDLLTMRAGIDWTNPDGDVGYTSNHPTVTMEVSDAWLPFIFSKPVTTKPGTEFDYNDGVSVLLGEIIHQVTGMRTDTYIASRLFAPLGITDHHWKITPAGETDTEGGLYLTSEDLVKIGRLMLQGGVWNGEQIGSQSWVDASVETRIQLSTEGEEIAYGYQWWSSKIGVGRHAAYSARGFGGQFLFIVPALDLTMVVNGWSANPGNSVTMLDKIVRELE